MVEESSEEAVAGQFEEIGKESGVTSTSAQEMCTSTCRLYM